MLNRKQIKADFCVVGGGMSGLCAAIAAARHGLKTVLMHERAVLGGNASSEIRMWLCGARGSNNRETGIIEEIQLENYYRNPTKNYYIWDTVLYDFAVREPNLTLLLNCTCMDAQTEQGAFADGRTVRIRRVTGYQMTTQTFIDVEAAQFADCSGDSILAPLTGAEYRVGREAASEFGEISSTEQEDRKTMGMSCLLQGRETTREVKFTPPAWRTYVTKEQMRGMGDPYDYSENYWYLELGGEQDSIHDTEEIAGELIPLAVGVWDYLKNRSEYDLKKWDLDFLGFLPGKRESRRLVGEYMVTQVDVSSCKMYPDTVAFGGWPLDDHYPGGFKHRGTPNTDYQTPAPYPLPYRALYSRNVENLFFAGRNISVTHMALSSVRVMLTCALFGQAIGTAAAIAVHRALTPHGVYREALTELQQQLMNDDCFLPGFTRRVSDICRNAELQGGTDELRNGQDRPNRFYETDTCGNTVRNGEAVCYRMAQPTHVAAVHLTFDSDLDRVSMPGQHTERTHSMRANVRLDAPQFGMPATLCRTFELWAEKEDGNTELILQADDNRRRAYDVPVNATVRALRLVMVRNWGNTDQTNLFSFDFR